MSIVAGIDFGTLSVRVSVFDSENGRLSSACGEYELVRKGSDPDWATQRHSDQIAGLEQAFKKAIKDTDISGQEIEAIAIDTTGSTIVPVDNDLQPIDDYYMWCDHRSKKEAAEITAKANEIGLENIKWCGGTYSSEFALGKVLHWLRGNPDKRKILGSFFEHCDLIAAMLSGVRDPKKAKRSACAAGHKWMAHGELGGLPPEKFLNSVDPLLGMVRCKLDGVYATSFEIAGYLSVEWANRLELRPGIPIPVGALDAHWDAIGAGIKAGDVVNVVGTSTCDMAIAKELCLIPGVSGVVKGSIHPDYWGIEAGLSAVGDIFDAIAKRSGSNIDELSNGLESYRAGQTGLLRFSWDNGDRTVLGNPELSGMTLGWTLTSTAQDEFFAAIEGTGFHTRIILERMMEYGVPVKRVINGGGIPQKNDVLNQVYANVFDKTVLVPEQEVTSLGSAIFAFIAAGAFESIEEAQQKLCPSYKEFRPKRDEAKVYERLYKLYRNLYFSFGQKDSSSFQLADVLPTLRSIATEAKQDQIIVLKVE